MAGVGERERDDHEDDPTSGDHEKRGYERVVGDRERSVDFDHHRGAIVAPTTNIGRLTAELAKFPSLDPQAIIAIAGHEGLGGGIGDNGTSFGPFQLHYGGAYPSSAPHGAQASQAWAWSPQGIDYALRQIQGVAGGLHGLTAIENISRRFERPANPGAEIADAAAHYRGGVPAGRVLASSSAPRPASSLPSAGSSGPAPSRGPTVGPLLAALIASTNANLGLGTSPTLAGILSAAVGNPQPRPPRGGGGLGGLEPPVQVPTVPGSFGKPRPKA